MEAKVEKYTDSVESEEKEKNPYKQISLSPIHGTHQSAIGYRIASPDEPGIVATPSFVSVCLL